jgi:predicted methyltransferase
MGYLPEQFVIDMAKKAGFILEARAEVNANTKDDRDHPSGVWTLPPSYRLGDENRDEYTAIGESDRMTLRFRKPS